MCIHARRNVQDWLGTGFRRRAHEGLLRTESVAVTFHGYRFASSCSYAPPRVPPDRAGRPTSSIVKPADRAGTHSLGAPVARGGSTNRARNLQLSGGLPALGEFALQSRVARHQPCDAGDPGWIRTIDLPLRRRPLYPLSYGVAPPPFCGQTGWQSRAEARAGGPWRYVAREVPRAVDKGLFCANTENAPPRPPEPQ